ncbi:MAG: KH domain-containing protein [Candidatus Methanofastidiosum sp.]|nr:KH domain-containing protein [Methanofastidiosum sp.]
MEQFNDTVVLETNLKSIVGKTKAVKIDRQIDERGVLLTVDVDPSDMGHLIGRKGNTIQSIRTILKIVGAKNQARVNIKIPGTQGPQASQEVDRVTDAIDDLKI